MGRDVVMFVYGEAEHDTRVWREAGTLHGAGWNVHVVGLQAGGLPTILDRPEGRLLRVGGTGLLPGTESPFRMGGGPLARVRWLWGYRAALLAWRDEAITLAMSLPLAGEVVWHAHDLTGLLPASALRKRLGGGLVYDSHELFVEAGSAARLPGPARRILAGYEDRLGRRADALIAVNDTIGAILADRFGLAATTIMNCPPLPATMPSRLDSPMRAALGLGARPVLLAHGIVARGRGVLNAVRALDHLGEDVALVVLGNGELAAEVDALAASDRYRGRLFRHPAVPYEDLLDWVAGCDVNVIALEPIDRKTILALPNKLFEALAAGAPVVVSDFPELARVARSDDLGATCNPLDPRSIAGAARALLDESPADVLARRERCARAARDHFNWELEASKLVALYERLPTSRNRGVPASGGVA